MVTEPAPGFKRRDFYREHLHRLVNETVIDVVFRDFVLSPVVSHSRLLTVFLARCIVVRAREPQRPQSISDVLELVRLLCLVPSDVVVEVPRDDASTIFDPITDLINRFKCLAAARRIKSLYTVIEGPDSEKFEIKLRQDDRRKESKPLGDRVLERHNGTLAEDAKPLVRVKAMPEEAVADRRLNRSFAFLDHGHIRVQS